MYMLVGLGNPGTEYEHTRHNAGRMALSAFSKKEELPEWKTDKKRQSLATEGAIKKEKFTCLLPETFMNKSGNAAAKLIRGKKELPELVVMHDDLDLPLGKFKISYGKNSGGHKGVESIMRALKTKNFVRIRIGISPKKKPDQKEILRFIIGKFKPSESEILKKVFKKISEALEVMATDSVDRAMSEFNG